MRRQATGIGAVLLVLALAACGVVAPQPSPLPSVTSRSAGTARSATARPTSPARPTPTKVSIKEIFAREMAAEGLQASYEVLPSRHENVGIWTAPDTGKTGLHKGFPKGGIPATTMSVLATLKSGGWIAAGVTELSASYPSGINYCVPFSLPPDPERPCELEHHRRDTTWVLVEFTNFRETRVFGPRFEYYVTSAPTKLDWDNPPPITAAVQHALLQTILARG